MSASDPLPTFSRCGRCGVVKLAELYDRTVRLWPEAVNLVGCDDPAEPLWPLVAAYEEIEGRVGNGDPWLEVSAWAFHQSLVETARAHLRRGHLVIRPVDVSLVLFEGYLSANLDDPSWAAEREVYLSQNPAWPSN